MALCPLSPAVGEAVDLVATAAFVAGFFSVEQETKCCASATELHKCQGELLQCGKVGSITGRIS
jgi:hypothetical protein